MLNFEWHNKCSLFKLKWKKKKEHKMTFQQLLTLGIDRSLLSFILFFCFSVLWWFYGLYVKEDDIVFTILKNINFIFKMCCILPNRMKLYTLFTLPHQPVSIHLCNHRFSVLYLGRWMGAAVDNLYKDMLWTKGGFVHK